MALGVAIPVLICAASLAVAAVRASHDEKVTATFTLPGDSTPQTKIVSRRATPEVELDAVTFHAALTQVLRASVACYVFGAAPEGASPTTPAGVAVLNVGPLQRTTWIDLNTGPAKQKNALALLSDFPALGGTDAYVGSGNFSLLVIGPSGGTVGVRALAQVVTTPATVAAPATAAGDQLVLVWARLWTSDGQWEYSWLAPAANAANAAWAAKATQFWTWVDESRGVFEAGPAVCKFPDPVGALNAGVGLSRFSYNL